MMEKECEQRLEKIMAGFKACRNAFTAIGDETRQLILMALLEVICQVSGLAKLQKKHI